MVRDRVRRWILLADDAIARPIAPGGRLRWVDAGLLAWFTLLTTAMIVRPIVEGLWAPLGFDAVVYTDAARALLAGGDPWRVSAFGITFAAPPPSLLPFVPLTLLPDEVVGWVGVVVAAASGFYSVRRLALPFWWLLFPPIALGIVAGSSSLLVLALLVRGGVATEAVAVAVRIYAALPLLGLWRHRSLAAAAVLLILTAPFLGWPTYLTELDHVAAVIATQTGGGGSLSTAPLLIPVAVAFLVLLGRRRAAWLLVPVLWPDALLHYNSIALPIVAETPLVAIALALPWSPVLVVAGLGGQVGAEQLAHWASGPSTR